MYYKSLHHPVIIKNINLPDHKGGRHEAFHHNESLNEHSVFLPVQISKEEIHNVIKYKILKQKFFFYPLTKPTIELSLVRMNLDVS